jgi:16S rRNA G966 N2-methylase RsmD
LSVEKRVSFAFTNRTDTTIKYIKAVEQYLYNSLLSPLVTCGTAADISELFDSSIDYIFTDPPFGSNIFYSDCNVLWEAWLQDFTDVKQEAVWNKSLKPEQGGKTRPRSPCRPLLGTQHDIAVLECLFPPVLRGFGLVQRVLGWPTP